VGQHDEVSIEVSTYSEVEGFGKKRVETMRGQRKVFQEAVERKD
jgi:hypothetical protein